MILNRVAWKALSGRWPLSGFLKEVREKAFQAERTAGAKALG